MLIIPLGIVLIETPLCRAAPSSCDGMGIYRLSFPALPYIMIGGGVLIGYNMKRASDVASYDGQSGDAEDDSDDGSVSLSV